MCAPCASRLVFSSLLTTATRYTAQWTTLIGFGIREANPAYILGHSTAPFNLVPRRQGGYFFKKLFVNFCIVCISLCIYLLAPFKLHFTSLNSPSAMNVGNSDRMLLK